MAKNAHLLEYQRVAATSIRGTKPDLVVPQATKIRAGVAGGLPSNSLLMDPVSGCLSAKAACYGTCFAAAAAFQDGIDFGKRITNELDEGLLHSDLEKIPTSQGHLRCGWNSDPSWNWELSTKVAEIAATHGKKTIFLTKAFGVLPPQIADRLAHAQAEIWVGMAAQSEDKNIQRRFEFIEDYRDAGGTAVVPLLTAAYALPHLAEKQDAIARMIIDKGFVGAENSMRVSLDDPIVRMEIIDESRLFSIQGETPPLHWSGRFYDDLLFAPTVTSLKDDYSGGIPSRITDENYNQTTMRVLFSEVIPTHEQLVAGMSATRPCKSGLSRSWS